MEDKRFPAFSSIHEPFRHRVIIINNIYYLFFHNLFIKSRNIDDASFGIVFLCQGRELLNYIELLPNIKGNYQERSEKENDFTTALRQYKK